MKKLISFIASAMVALGIMCGCTKNDDVTPNNDTVVVVKEGTIKLENDATGSAKGSYSFTVLNQTTGEIVGEYKLNPGYYQTITVSPGTYNVYMKQLDGYTFYATEGDKTKTLRDGYTITFSTSSL